MLIKFDYFFLRPLLTRILPSSWLIRFYSWIRPLSVKALVRSSFLANVPSHPVQTMGLTFRNPLGVAAGLDKDGRLLDVLYRLGAGFVVVGTALDRPHSGNPGIPWVPLSASNAAINSLGLPSPGIDTIVGHIKNFRHQHHAQDFPIGLSVMGHPLDDPASKNQGILTCIEKAAPWVDFIEINQSCPNVGEDLTRLDVPEACFETSLPIVLKLQPMKPDPKILSLCAQGKISALVIGNTVKNHDLAEIKAPDRRHARYFQKHFGGGMSGAPLFKNNLRLLDQWSKALTDCHASTVLIGCGGVHHPRHVKSYLEHGPLSQLYTGLWSSYATHGPLNCWTWLLSDL